MDNFIKHTSGKSSGWSDDLGCGDGDGVWFGTGYGDPIGQGSACGYCEGWSDDEGQGYGAGACIDDCIADVSGDADGFGEDGGFGNGHFFDV